MLYRWGYWQMQLSKYTFLSLGALALSSCGSLGSDEFDSDIPTSGANPFPAGEVSDTPVRIGEPFTVDGTVFTPEDVTSYDEVGYASWYGSELDGSTTANGEIFSASSSSASHKTLPLPTYAEVTALDTGRTILVRINDRGPLVKDRLIDLSESAARQLGITGQELAGVRVRKVNPPNQERAILRNGGQALARIDTPESLTRILKERLAKLPVPQGRVRAAAARPTPPVAGAPRNSSGDRFVTEGAPGAPRATPRAAPRNDGRFVVEGAGSKRLTRPAAVSGFVVQLSSFSSRDRADALARKVGANVVPSSDGRLFRVRYGPFATEVEAQQGLANARKRGYPQARIFRE